MSGHLRALVNASVDENGAAIFTSSGVAAPARGVAQPDFHLHESNDNPFREPQFKTPRYRPGVPQQCESIEGQGLTVGASPPGTTTSPIETALDFTRPPTSSAGTSARRPG